MEQAVARCCLALSVVLASGAQLLFRFAMQSHESHGIEPAVVLSSSTFDLTSGQLVALLIGVVLYATSMVSWILSLVRFDVTVAYPMMAISYLIVYLAAVSLPFYNETISNPALFGMAFIVIGVCFVPYEAQKPIRIETPE